MNRIRRTLSSLRASFWFTPTLIVAGSAALALGLIEAGSIELHPWMARWPRLFGAGAAGARGMLSTIAGAMMTVVGVTFSMTLVTLVLASSQYTSRILRNFMRDGVTQVALGVFAGIFSYSLIVLRTIRGGDEGSFVPSLAVTVAVFLAVGGICVLIFFIHHIASSIQASSVIAAVAEETIAAVERLFPDRVGDDQDGEPGPAEETRRWIPVRAENTGYLQGVDGDALVRLAREHLSVVRMELPLGAFVVRGAPLASVSFDEGRDGALPDPLRTGVLAAYAVGRHRTIEQDPMFGVRQLVDIALKALSPGVNDTTTGAMCVDYLTAIVAHRAARGSPPPQRYDGGELRVIAIGSSFDDLLHAAFDEIRGNAAGNATIVVRLLDAIATVATRTGDPSRRKALDAHVQTIIELGERTLLYTPERALLASAVDRARRALES